MKNAGWWIASSTARKRSRTNHMRTPSLRVAAAALTLTLCALAQTPPAPAPPAPAPAAPAPPQGAVVGAYNLNGAPLLEVISTLAKELKLNYILDPGVKGGSVTINTYGVVRDVDVRALLETILRMNNLALVQTDNLYRIVP